MSVPDEVREIISEALEEYSHDHFGSRPAREAVWDFLDSIEAMPAPDWQPAPDGEYKCACENPDCTNRLILHEGDLNIEDDDGFLMSIVLPDNLRLMLR